MPYGMLLRFMPKIEKCSSTMAQNISVIAWNIPITEKV
jgi:hypothetical protein